MPDISVPDLEPVYAQDNNAWIGRYPREIEQPSIFPDDWQTEIKIPRGKNTDVPEGWDSPWPELPRPDMIYRDTDLSQIKLSKEPCPCGDNRVIGFYRPWHVLALSYRNEYGRPAVDPDQLRTYNESLPACNRYGIHVCIDAVERYIEAFPSTTRVEEPQDYREYCTFLTLAWVLGHEWGHYRAEVMSFQLEALTKAVTGGQKGTFKPSYLAYLLHGCRNFDTQFEEVFAEWAALKFGVFNYRMEKPPFARKYANWNAIEVAVRKKLTEAMRNPARHPPYSHIGYWIDVQRLISPRVLSRLSSNVRSMNRSISECLLLDGIHSLRDGKMVDLLMHNLMQFTPDRTSNGVIRSAPKRYPSHPDSAFYHIGEDDCLQMSDKRQDQMLRLNTNSWLDSRPSGEGMVGRVLDNWSEPNLFSRFGKEIILPIPICPEFLPLDAVCFHG